MVGRNKSAVANFMWRFAERCGAQFVTLFDFFGTDSNTKRLWDSLACYGLYHDHASICG